MTPIELTQLEAAEAAEVPGPTHRSWRERGLFEGSVVQVGKGAHTSYSLDAVFRGNLLGAMNGWPLTDKEKCTAARWAEAGRVSRYPLKGGHKVTRYPDGSSSVYDENAPSSPSPRYVLVRPGEEPRLASEENLVDAISSNGWPSFLVLDADLLFARAKRAIKAAEERRGAK